MHQDLPNPPTWRRLRLRHLVTFNPSPPSNLAEDQEVSFLPMEAIGVDGSLDLSSTRRAGDVRAGYAYFEDGDVAFAKVTPCFENGKGALFRGLVSGRGFGTTEVTVLRPGPRIDARFLHFLLVGPMFRQPGAGHMTGAGGLKRVPDEFTRNFELGLPSLQEQRRIADLLDRETARIDALIEKKIRFIELLLEKRQSLISSVVTRGLISGTRLRDSGVEFLGDVPDHYKLTRLMHVTAYGRDIMYGIVLPGPDVETGVPIVKGGNVRPERLRLDELARTTPEIEAPYARARLRPNDIVYSIRGSIGDAELVPEELLDANITQDVARVSPGPSLCARWLLYVLKSDAVFGQLDRDVTGATIRGINIFSLKRVMIAVPPKDEQAQIAEHLDRQLERLDKLVVATRRSIDLLKEHRSTLITAAVAGQIDVRADQPTSALEPA